MSEGIVLRRRLSDKSSTFNSVMLPIDGGIAPFSSLPARFNILRDAIVIMEGGILPVILLSARFNLLRDCSFERSSGIGPVKPFVCLDKSSSWRLEIEPLKTGSSPERALDDMSNRRNSGRLFIDSGRLP